MNVNKDALSALNDDRTPPYGGLSVHLSQIYGPAIDFAKLKM